MVTLLFTIAGVSGLFLFSEILAKICRDLNEYNTMKQRGFMRMKNDKGEDFWVGYGD